MVYTKRRRKFEVKGKGCPITCQAGSGVALPVLGGGGWSEPSSGRLPSRRIHCT